MFLHIAWIYIIPKCNSLLIEIRRGCLTANFPIFTRMVHVFLETVTLRLLFRWMPNLTWLYLATRGNFLALKKCKILWCHSISSQKPFLQWKISKIYTFLDFSCIFVCHTGWSSTKFDMELSDTYVHVTLRLKISKSFLE